MGLFDIILDGIFGIASAVTSHDSDHIHEQTLSPNISKQQRHQSQAYSDHSKKARFVKVRRSYRTKSGATFTPLWQKRGWMLNAQNKNYSVGQYKFYNKQLNETLQWEGAVKISSYEIKVFIKNPPAVLKNHKHWECFMHQGDGWYLVHFLERINGLDDAILNVQRLISEAYWFC